jgi:hypothetical protein
MESDEVKWMKWEDQNEKEFEKEFGLHYVQWKSTWEKMKEKESVLWFVAVKMRDENGSEEGEKRFVALDVRLRQANHKDEVKDMKKTVKDRFWLKSLKELEEYCNENRGKIERTFVLSYFEIGLDIIIVFHLKNDWQGKEGIPITIITDHPQRNINDYETLLRSLGQKD